MTTTSEGRARAHEGRRAATPRPTVPRGVRPFWATAIFCVLGGLALAHTTRHALRSLLRFLELNRSPLENPSALSRPATVVAPAPELSGPAPSDAETSKGVSASGLTVFRLFAPAAEKVFLGGSFNDYLAEPMTRRSDGVWESTRTLAPGLYTYKFKVDGRWQLDPANPQLSLEGNHTSILEVK